MPHPSVWLLCVPHSGTPATRGARRGAVCARLVADIAPLGAALCWSARQALPSLRRAQPPSSLQHSKSKSAASQGCVEPLDTCNLRTSFHPVCPILLIHPNSNLAGQRQARAESPCRSCQERSLLYLGACTHSLHALCVSHGVSGSCHTFHCSLTSRGCSKSSQSACCAHKGPVPRRNGFLPSLNCFDSQVREVTTGDHHNIAPDTAAKISALCAAYFWRTHTAFSCAPGFFLGSGADLVLLPACGGISIFLSDTATMLCQG